MTRQRRIDASVLGRELEFTTSRSSGPGGQNVNKVNTKVTLRFDVSGSQALTVDEKEILLRKLASRLTNVGVLILSSQDKRSQLQNKEAVIAKFEVLVAKSFRKKKVRKATKPSKSAVEKRITQKKHRSEKKKWRSKP
ncbi:MAG TPA: alternative ribosome rescue aminoacyl-tRNA hydrolase ArfB [Cyclobacteriaceae bacterium]